MSSIYSNAHESAKGFAVNAKGVILRQTLLTFIFLSFSWLASADDVVIPLKTMNAMYGGGTFSVPCSGPDMSGTCQIDTGLNVSYFSANAFTVLPASIGKATYTSVTGSVVKCDYAALPSIQLNGAVDLGPLEPVICSAEENKSQTNLLGLDAFAERSFILNAKKYELVLLEKNPVLPNSFEIDNVGHILMKVQSGFKKPLEALAMFDTGAAVSTVDIELVKAQPENFTIVETNAIGTDAHGNPINSYLVIGSVRVGQILIVAEYFIAMDFSPFQKVSGSPIQLILGYNAIDHFEWTINMKDKTWSNSDQ